MFHQGFASELARTIVRDRMDTSARGAAPVRVHAPVPAFERALSIAGAIALLSLVILGPVGTAILAVATWTAIWLARGARGHVRREASLAGEPVAPERRDRWRAWRVHEPDPEYLRRRAA